MRSPRSKYLIALFLLAAATLPGIARMKVKFKPEAVNAETALTDSVDSAQWISFPEMLSLIRCFGYDKPLSATQESFFVTNSTPDTLAQLRIEIIYQTPGGIALHRGEHTLPVSIAPGETRRVQLRSWDRTNTFYFHKTPPRHAERYTPYKVQIHPRAVQTK